MRSSVFCIASGASHAISGMRRSAVTDAVGLAPSLLPRPGAVAITVVTTTALDRVSGVVCGDACVPGFRSGLARESVGGVGLEVAVGL